MSFGWFISTCCWTLLVGNGVLIVESKSHLKDARLQAVRGQILTKLGLTSPPDEGIEVAPSKEDIDAFNAVNKEVHEQTDQELDCIQHKHHYGYFAQSVVSLQLVKRTGRTRQYQGT